MHSCRRHCESCTGFHKNSVTKDADTTRCHGSSLHTLPHLAADRVGHFSTLAFWPFQMWQYISIITFLEIIHHINTNIDIKHYWFKLEKKYFATIVIVITSVLAPPTFQHFRLLTYFYYNGFTWWPVLAMWVSGTWLTWSSLKLSFHKLFLSPVFVAWTFCPIVFPHFLTHGNNEEVTAVELETNLREVWFEVSRHGESWL